MDYVMRIGDRYYYNRRVPAEYRIYDPRSLIRIGLKTDSRSVARKKSVIVNEQVEAYWMELVSKGLTHSSQQFDKTVEIARRIGMVYQPMSVLLGMPMHELAPRILAADNATEQQVQAILGAKPVPEIKLLDALKKYWGFSKDKILRKSPLQVRKWENPRKRAVKHIVAIVGNKDINKVTREDLIAFKDWWIDRISKGMSEATANRDFIMLKVVLETVSDNMQMALPIEALFKKFMFKKRKKVGKNKARRSFTTAQIIELLESPKLNNMHPEMKGILYVLAETGARPTEIVDLKREDIRLHDEIPHIVVTDREEKELKTV